MTQATRVDQVRLGDHACLTFTDGEERLDLLAAFVRAGLSARQRVLCWTEQVSPERLTAELAVRSVRGRAATRRGQLRIAASTPGGDVSADTMLAAVAAKLDTAIRLGYTGLRLTVDLCWATRPAAAEQLLAFENGLARLFTDGRLSVICQYDRDRFDAVTLAFAATTHSKTVTAQVYHDSPLLRVCRQYSPAGIRLAGEIDYRHQDILEQALGECCRLDRHPVVNLARLGYIDAACATTVVHAARRLPASRRMTLLCHGLVAKVLDLAGAGEVAQLRVMTGHDRL